MLIFILCVLIFIGVLYNYIKNRNDEESRGIYGIFTFIAMVALLISGVNIIPEGAFDLFSDFTIKIFIIVIYVDLLLSGFIFLAGNSKIGLKKAGLISAVSVLALMLPLGGDLLSTRKTATNETGAAQEVYDRSYDAYLYAKELFISENNVDEGQIRSSSYGFIPDENIRYFVSFDYDGGGEESRYGYILSVDDEHKCTVIDRGEGIGY